MASRDCRRVASARRSSLRRSWQGGGFQKPATLTARTSKESLCAACTNVRAHTHAHTHTSEPRWSSRAVCSMCCSWELESRTLLASDRSADSCSSSEDISPRSLQRHAHSPDRVDITNTSTGTSTSTSVKKEKETHTAKGRTRAKAKARAAKPTARRKSASTQRRRHPRMAVLHTRHLTAWFRR
jgi:hypothetical protein